MKKIFSIASAVKVDSAPAHELVYRQLRDREIRLVKLLPGSGEAIVKCELQIVSLDADPKYDALSYRWGEPANKKWVSCNSQRCNVTKDLHIALKRFRKRDKVVTFWIDQICINQADIEERAEQVKMMQEIYSHAECVYIWLGPESQDSRLAMQVLLWLSKEVRKYENFDKSNCLDWNDTWNQTLHKEIATKNEKDWRAISAFIGRPWFGRIWVVQEIVFAKRGIVVCGKGEIPWKDFADGISRVIRVGMTATGYMPVSHWRLLYMVNIIDLFKKDGHIPPEDLLPQSRFFEASDNHDNVFAIMGLSPECEVTTIDYSRSVEDVFIDIARYIIFKHKRNIGSCAKQCIADLLSQSQGDGSLSLPSWVPDWSKPSDMNFEITRRADIGFKAGGPGELDVFETEDTRKLRLRGKIFDSVGALSSVAPAPSTAELDKALSMFGQPMTFYTHLHQERWLLNLWINETSAIAWHHSHYTDDASRTVAYSRTLVCNNLHNFKEEGMKNEEVLHRSYWAFRTGLSILFPAGVPNGAPLHSLAHALNPHVTDFETFEISMHTFGVGRRFFTTTGGYMALGNSTVEAGDLVCVFEGAKSPWVIRPAGEDYLLIGECYVHGAMNSEVMETDALPVQDIILK